MSIVFILFLVSGYAAGSSYVNTNYLNICFSRFLNIIFRHTLVHSNIPNHHLFIHLYPNSINILFTYLLIVIQLTSIHNYFLFQSNETLSVKIETTSIDQRVSF